MHSIFLDESGDLGFGRGSRYFVLGSICTEKLRQLNRAMRGFNQHLLDKGWSPELEIKAGTLWRSKEEPRLSASYAYKQTPEVPMRLLLGVIARLDCEIEYAVADLRQPAQRLHTAPSAALYNHWVWQLLKERLCHFDQVNLSLDRRNDEQTSCTRLEGYLECSVGIERALRGKLPLNLQMHHYHAGSVEQASAGARSIVECSLRGIQAADAVCWAINRSYEFADRRWLKLIECRIKSKCILLPPIGNPVSALPLPASQVPPDEEPAPAASAQPAQKVCRTLLRQWRRQIG
jgi:hypothetical protein